MRIAIVTDNERREDGIRQILGAGGASHSVSLIGDGLARPGPVLD